VCGTQIFVGNGLDQLSPNDPDLDGRADSQTHPISLDAYHADDD
jgi:hypothetical protein